MTIVDRIYGKVVVDSTAIVELIKSKPVQILKGIAQFGIPDKFYHLPSYSRYEHSVGVMLLLKKLGASEEEQIAGLLHDVSHTAFSHVIDWVIGDGKTEDYQDEQHERYVTRSDIPTILKKHGYSFERIVDYHHFGLLEQDLPNLCADRVDYSLRELPADIAEICVLALTSKDNKIVFADEKAALLFARHFLKQQMEHWGGFEAVSRYSLFADALRHGLKDGSIAEDDFWRDDAFVIKKLATLKNKKLQATLQTLRSKSLDHLPKSMTVVHKKFRFVDPLFIEGEKLTRLSKVNKKYAEELEEARHVNQVGITVPDIA